MILLFLENSRKIYNGENGEKCCCSGKTVELCFFKLNSVVFQKNSEYLFLKFCCSHLHHRTCTIVKCSLSIHQFPDWLTTSNRRKMATSGSFPVCAMCTPGPSGPRACRDCTEDSGFPVPVSSSTEAVCSACTTH